MLKFNIISFFRCFSSVFIFLSSRKNKSILKRSFVSHAKIPRVDFPRQAGLATRRREEKRKDATNLWFTL